MPKDKMRENILKKLFLVAFIVLLGSMCQKNIVSAESLKEPEDGWERVIHNDERIKYSGIWNHAGNSSSNSTNSNSGSTGYCTFNFYGTKLRVIADTFSNSARRIKITIDGEESHYDGTRGYVGSNVIVYETNLKLGQHQVKLETDRSYGTGLLIINAFDVYNPESPVNMEKSMIFNLETEKKTIDLNQTTDVSLVINNITNIAAEDIYITYDTGKLKYLSCDEVAGIKLVYKDEANGKLRFILASRGEDNIIKSKKVLLNLHFEGIESGDALVDITKARVSDGITMEENVEEKLCGETTITINEGLKDVNGDGKFTLLDLGIDARHFGKNPSEEELSGYNTDVVKNNSIDEEDLVEIAKQILSNPDYEFNK